MPTYTFINNQTGEVFDEFMSWKDREDFLKTNPNIEPIITAPTIVGGVSLSDKTSDGFKEVMSRIGENAPGSSVDQQYNRKSIKRSQTEQILAKHRAKNK